MKKFINYLEHITIHKKLTKTQFYFSAFGLLLFLTLAITLPLINSPLKKKSKHNQ